MPACHPFLRRVRRWPAGAPLPVATTAPGEHARRFTVAQGVVRGFYAFLLYLGVFQLPRMGDFFVREVFSPLWPVAWISQHHGTTAMRGVILFYALASLGGAIFAHLRAARILAFLGTLEFVALNNSFGKIGHGLHLLVLVSGILVLLPPGWSRPAPHATRALRQQTLRVVWLAQASILLSYTMSGLEKLVVGVAQLLHGEPNIFLPGALGAHIAQRLLESNSHAVIGDWIIRHPLLSWPLMPTAVVFETGALLAAFRPALGRPVAAALIFFHLGTSLTMTISFPQNCLLLALFFFASPFEPANLNWRKTVFAVPFAHNVWTFWQSRRVRVVE